MLSSEFVPIKNIYLVVLNVVHTGVDLHWSNTTLYVFLLLCYSFQVFHLLCLSTFVLQPDLLE